MNSRWEPDAKIFTILKNGDIWFIDAITCNPNIEKIEVSCVFKLEHSGNLTIYPLRPEGTSRIKSKDFDFSVFKKYKRNTDIESKEYMTAISRYRSLRPPLRQGVYRCLTQ